MKLKNIRLFLVLRESKNTCTHLCIWHAFWNCFFPALHEIEHTHSHGQLCGTRKHQFSSFKLILILPLPLPDMDLFAHCVHTHSVAVCTMQTFEMCFTDFRSRLFEACAKSKNCAQQHPNQQPAPALKPTKNDLFGHTLFAINYQNKRKQKPKWENAYIK